MSSLLFTDDAQAAFDYAVQDTRWRHLHYVDAENLLLGLLEQAQRPPLSAVFVSINTKTITQQIAGTLGMVRETQLPQVRGITKILQELMVTAGNEARFMGHNFVNSGHLLLAMFTVPAMGEILQNAGLTVDKTREIVAANSPKPSAPTREIKLQSPEQQRKIKQTRAAAERPISRDIYILIGVVFMTGFFWFAAPDIFVSFWLVLLGWVASVSVHEFFHAVVAYWGGDYTVKDKGYLTMNPLRYTHPLISIGLPLLFVMLGGIGLPGGAVYIETHRLRTKWWRSAVSFAGPCGTAVMALVFSFPFWTGMAEFSINPYSLHSRLLFALAFLSVLQVWAIFFNLLPIPPLDGFGIIEPFLPPEIAHSLRSLGIMTLFLVIFLFRIPAFAEPIRKNVYSVTDSLQVDPVDFQIGYQFFRFWEKD